jgi:hypothetical protein
LITPSAASHFLRKKILNILAMAAAVINNGADVRVND